MKSTPILFNGEMVRAILDGRKTTDAEYRIEFDHEYSLRISLMCGSGEPSVEQKIIAFKIAEQHEQELKDQEHERSR